MKSIKELAAKASLAALAATMMVGNADALKLDAAPGTVGAAAIDGKTGLKVASELDYSKVAAADAVVNMEPSTGLLPSGNLFFDIAVTNATFDAALNGASAVKGCGGGTSANIVTGGAKGDSTVRFAVSGFDGCKDTAELIATLPIKASGKGDVTGSYTVLLTDGTAIDGGALNVPLVAVTPAFSVDIAAGTKLTADVAATKGAYTDFTPTGISNLGTVQIKVASVNTKLGTQAAAISDVEGVTVAVAGDYTGLDPVAWNAGADLAGDKFTVKSGTATYSSTTATDIDDLAAAIPVSVTPTTKAGIVAGSYAATVTLDLGASFIDPAASAGTLGTVVRNGSSEVLPWTASATQAGATGSETFVRVSNPTANAYGAITARVISSTNSGTVGATGTLAASLAAGGELIVTSAQLEAALGNFGRGDLEISVEGTGAYITRLVQRADGVYEIKNR